MILKMPRISAFLGSIKIVESSALKSYTYAAYYFVLNFGLNLIIKQ